MIVLLNGTLGVGKTTIGRTLSQTTENSVFLDGGELTWMNPFNPKKQEDVLFVFNLFKILAREYKNKGLTNFFISYEIETPEALEFLQKQLASIDPEFHAFRLTADEESVFKRIKKRAHVNWEQELHRAKELMMIHEIPTAKNKLGIIVETSNQSSADVIKSIARTLELLS